MDQRQEMMDDAIDDVTGLEDEEEGEEVVNQVLDEIGIDMKEMVRSLHKSPHGAATDSETAWRNAVGNPDIGAQRQGCAGNWRRCGWG